MRKYAGMILALSITSCLFAETASQGVTLIPDEAIFKGTLRCRQVRVDGIYEGKMMVDDKFEISENGAVKGDVEAVEGTVKGRVQGNINTSEDLNLASTAMVSGVITCRNLIVEKGAIYTGKSEMGELKEIGGKKETTKKRTTTTRTRRTRSRSYY